MHYFDDLPHYLLAVPEEPTFQRMVRCLTEAKDGRMKFSQFVKLVPGCPKRVFLQPFFSFTSSGHGDCEIELRFPLFCAGIWSDVRECAIRHWQKREELTCKKKHRLVEVALARKHGSLCFSCNVNACSGMHYTCIAGCTFQVCSDCMVFPEDLRDVHRALKRKVPDPAASSAPERTLASEDDIAAAQGSVSSASSAAAVRPLVERPLVICLIRGHVLRVGERLSDNSSGDMEDLRTVLQSLQARFDSPAARATFHIRYLLDI